MIGRTLAHYHLTATLGAGGMGEVYRATDSRLGREVAIKLLPAGFAADPERLARFAREAKLLAQLQHPNIASVYGLEDADGTPALVMELVEGPTLADRLQAGSLPLEECLAIARQLAEALEEAHAKGIVHRDLKPQNVKLGAGGRVKVLDFGLAKAMDGAGPPSSTGELGASPTMMNSPTVTGAGTRLGVILGTAAYMAPEQARGGAVDERADVWSFGVVLFEMLTGRSLFAGETVSDTLAGVLKSDVDFSALPAGTPRAVRELLRRCLRRKPRERLQAIGDARVVLEEVLADPHADEGAALAAAGTAATLPSRRPVLPWTIAALGVAAAAAFAVLWLAAPKTDAGKRLVHASLVAPPETGFGDTFALSPDGRRIVFQAIDRETRTGALWLRDLERGEATRLAATEGGQMAFWSPDGSQLAFFADGKLKRIDPRRGPAQTICEAPAPRGGAWGADGRIVLAASFRVGLSIVPAAGGVPRPLTQLGRDEKSHRFPVFLPGGKTILFLAQTAEGGARDDRSTIEAFELATGRRTRLVEANSSPLFAAPGHLMFWREGALLAQAFDPRRLAVHGDAVALASPVAYTQNEHVLASVSQEGTLAYREGERGTFSSFVWLDRTGIGLAVSIVDQGSLGDLAISHDGKRLVFSNHLANKGDRDLWVHDVERGASARLTFEEGSDHYPVWSPDDRHLYYANDRRNDGVIFRRAADGSDVPVEIGTTPAGIWPLAAAHDGRWLAVGSMVGRTSMDILRFDLVTKQVSPLVETPFFDDDAAVSPDDRLLAYASEQSGRWEVYVQALAGESGRWQVSTGGGFQPRWRRDGRELFFLAPPDALMSVTVEPGPVPRFSTPREIFRQPIQSFDVTPDGQRIVGLRLSDSDVNRPLTLISNWPLKLPAP